MDYLYCPGNATNHESFTGPRHGLNWAQMVQKKAIEIQWSCNILLNCGSDQSKATQMSREVK